MPSRRRLSVWLIVLAQSATLIAAPIAACCLAGPEDTISHVCPHEMETGTACPMHAAPANDATPSDGTAWRSCDLAQGLLSWLHTPVAPPEPPQAGAGTPIDWTTTAPPAIPSPLESTATPPAPPPRG